MKNLLIALFLTVPTMAHAGIYYDLRQNASSGTLKMGGNLSLGSTTTGQQTINLDGLTGNITGNIGGVIAGVVDVAAKATGGAGTSGSPWTGWDTAITWAGQTTYFFRQGYFSYATCPNWALAGLTIQGASQQGTVLKYTGSANAVCVDGGSVSTPAANYGFTLRDLRIVGSAGTQDAIYMRNVHHINIANVSANNFGGSGLHTYFVIDGIVTNFKVDVNEGLGNPDVTPSTGIYLDGGATGIFGPTNAVTFINPIITATRGTCIYLGYAQGNNIVGGDAESCASGISVYLSTLTRTNLISKLYANATIEDVGGATNEFSNMTGASLKLIGAAYDKVFGGSYSDINIDGASIDNQLTGVMYNPGPFTDSGARTMQLNNFQYGNSSATYSNSSISASLTVKNNLTVATSSFTVTAGQVAIGGAATTNSALTVIGKTSGNGPTLDLSPNGGDIKFALGGGLFLDGAYSYTGASYIKSPRAGAIGVYSGGPGVTTQVVDFGTSTVIISSLTVLSASGVSVPNGAVTAASFSGAGTGLTGTAASLTAGQATALATAGTAASSGFVCRGVDASGNCLAATVQSSAVSSSTSPISSGALFTHAALTGTSAHGATTTNTASQIVARDGSGNFAAGTITAVGLSVSGTTNIANRSTAISINTKTGTSASFNGCVSVSTIANTTTGGPVMLMFSGDGSNSTLLDGCAIWMLQDGAYIPGTSITTPTIDCTSATANAACNLSWTNFVNTTPSAAAHQYCFGVGVTVGGTCTAGYNVNVGFTALEIK